ncbi:MAG: hypothetical protein NTY88_03115 [Bacteroidetes bacterium]|nr:hypothetical protein [Bacteroidota bacterium]
MKTEKENWIEEILNCVENIQPVQVRGDLFAGIQSRLHGSLVHLEHVSTRTVWLAAASIALLFALNFAAFIYSSPQKQSAVHSSALIQNSFDIYSNS